MMPTGFDYVGAGNSTTKKDAQANAAKDFVQYLVRQGLIKPEDVPDSSSAGPAGNPSEQSSDGNNRSVEVHPLPNSTIGNEGTVTKVLLFNVLLFIYLRRIW